MAASSGATFCQRLLLGSNAVCALRGSSHISPSLPSAPVPTADRLIFTQFSLLYVCEMSPSSTPPAAFQTILAGRKCYRMSKDKNEVVWPPLLEAALMEGWCAHSLDGDDARVVDRRRVRQASKNTPRPNPSRPEDLLGSPTVTSSSPSTSSRRRARYAQRSRSGVASSSSATRARGSTVSFLSSWLLPALRLSIYSPADHGRPRSCCCQS